MSQKKKKKKSGAYIRYIWREKHARYLTMFCIYVRYIAGVLKTRSNFAAKFKVRARPNILVGGGGGGGAVSWLVACKLNKYEVTVHSQNNSLDLFMGGLIKEMLTCWVREKGLRAICKITYSEVTLVMFQRSVPNIADTLMAFFFSRSKSQVSK